MNKYMEEAIKEAYSGIEQKHGGPFGCVIVKDGTIVGRGHNEVIKNNDPTCHGEMMAIRDACKNLGTFDLTGCELYTTGYPCLMCFTAILWANIDKVYYACNTTDTEIIGFRDKEFEDSIMKRKQEMCIEMERESGIQLYREYAGGEGHTHY